MLSNAQDAFSVTAKWPPPISGRSLSRGTCAFSHSVQCPPIRNVHILLMLLPRVNNHARPLARLFDFIKFYFSTGISLLKTAKEISRKVRPLRVIGESESSDLHPQLLRSRLRRRSSFPSNDLVCVCVCMGRQLYIDLRNLH